MESEWGCFLSLYLILNQSIAIPADYNPIKDAAVKLKSYERRTSNVQHRILNEVFCQFINRRSEAISSFDVQRWMFDVQKTLYPAVQHSLIINILFLNLTTMPLGLGKK